MKPSESRKSNRQKELKINDAGHQTRETDEEMEPGEREQNQQNAFLPARFLRRRRDSAPSASCEATEAGIPQAEPAASGKASLYRAWKQLTTCSWRGNIPTSMSCEDIRDICTFSASFSCWRLSSCSCPCPAAHLWKHRQTVRQQLKHPALCTWRERVLRWSVPSVPPAPASERRSPAPAPSLPRTNSAASATGRWHPAAAPVGVRKDPQSSQTGGGAPMRHL